MMFTAQKTELDSSPLSNSGLIQQYQRDVLINAIDDYLFWRDNKDSPDTRGYAITLFSWLRHYTDFGKNRAINLKNNLISQQSNPIQLLQNHFQNDSTVNNHSLDTYILEGVLKNKELFLIDAKFVLLNTSELRKELQNSILAQPQYSYAKYAFMIARMHEDSTNIKQACQFYAMAALNHHDESLKKLKALATRGTSEAQYYIGAQYYHSQGKFTQAIKWCLLAAEQQHPEANTYLRQTKFDVKHYLYIAQRYEEGNMVCRNISTALFFYEHAAALNSSEAAYRLGQLYQPSFQIPGLTLPPSNSQKSFNYFLKAAQQKNTCALEAMRNIVECCGDNQLTFKLANTYLTVFNNASMALMYFKSLMDNGFPIAIQELNSLTKNNPEHAYKIAQLYENEGNYSQAFKYYAIAMLNNHQQSHQIIHSAITENNSEAQYALGFYYYHYQGQIKKALHWCLQAAEQLHKKALDYLFNTTFDIEQYLYLARKYEQGSKITQNIKFAIIFYEKACALESIEAAISLGKLYQPFANDNYGDCLEKNAKKSFDYYFIAARKKHKPALEAMEKIVAFSEDNELQLRLGITYLKVFDEPILALNYFKDMAENNNQSAIEQLEILTQNPEYAYLVAKSYETNVGRVGNFAMAGQYYARAIQYSESQVYQEIVQKEMNLLLHSPQITNEELNEIGELFYLGKNGTSQNHSQAIRWFEQALIKNNAKACYHLGCIYEQGLSVEKHTILAVQYFQLAEDRQYSLATEKLNILLHAPERTCQELHALALMYQHGSEGILVNYSKMTLLYQKASEQGDSAAALHLGHFYQLDHEDFPCDSNMSFSYYLRAAILHSYDALIPLESLGEVGSAEQQRELSQLYGLLFLDKDKYEYWQAKANEVAQFEFTMR